MGKLQEGEGVGMMDILFRGTIEYKRGNLTEVKKILTDMRFGELVVWGKVNEIEIDEHIEFKDNFDFVKFSKQLSEKLKPFVKSVNLTSYKESECNDSLTIKTRG